jgi:menaquinone-specific isochorismate synthase
MTSARVDVAARLHATTREIDAPPALLDHLGEHGFAWFGDGFAFVTAGAVARLDACDATEYLAAIDHDGPVNGARGPLAAGALSWRGDRLMTVPARVVGIDREGRGWVTAIEHGTATGAARHEPARRYEVEAKSSLRHWTDAVGTVLRSIDAGHVEKVVLAREVRVRASAPFDVPRVLAQLRRTQPGCFVFADDGFVGASPELLVHLDGTEVTCRPMAGTITSDVHTDALLGSDKNGREHDVVARAVAQELERWCTDVDAAAPEAARFADVTHLVTNVRGRLRDASTSALDLARALHPTPAVAGTPRDAAVELIEHLEATARGNYAGPVGWVTAGGDGAFAVALRCAQLDGNEARLHAGAGIVAGSDPEGEWDETSAKFEPMLRALVRP